MTDHDPRDRDAWRPLAREQLALGADADVATSAQHVLELGQPSSDPPTADHVELLARARRPRGLGRRAGIVRACPRARSDDRPGMGTIGHGTGTGYGRGAGSSAGAPRETTPVEPPATP